MRVLLLAIGLTTTGAAHAAVITYAPGQYTYVAPTNGQYAISVQGAQGGPDFFLQGGLGAISSAVFNLTAGERIDLSVGGAGAFSGTSGRGGGGSFVYAISTDTLLLAAGGGGGATSVDSNNNYDPSAGGNASTTSTPLTLAGRTVAGVDGTNGFCCGSIAFAGVGGSSFVNASPVFGYVGGASLTLNTAGGAGAVTITEPVLTAVPEPASFALFGAGLLGLGMVRRRRA